MNNTQTEMEALIEQLTRPAILAAIKKVPSALSNAERNGVFPASWFGSLETLALKNGIILSRTLFNFTGMEADNDASAEGEAA